MQRYLPICLVVVVLNSLVAVAAATPISIANHSFETTLAATPLTPPRAASWSFSFPENQFSLPADASLLASGKAPDGNRVLASISVLGGSFYVFNVADELLTANTRYTVLIDVGRPLPGYSIATSFGSVPLTPAGYRISLQTFPGGDELASDVNSLVTPSGGFVTAKLTFDIPHGDPRVGEGMFIGLGVVSGAEPGSAYAALFDNVRIDAAPIPEPSTLALGGLAATALLGIAIRARRNTLRRPA